MKGMKSAKEYYQAPPPGEYPSRVIAATDKISSKGNSMIELELEVLAPQHLAGATTRDYIITDGTAKGGGMGKTKLRGLGIDTSSDEELPDSVLCQQLLGLELLVTYGNEQMMGKDAKGEYTIPQTAFDDQLGREVPLNKLTVKGYSRHATRATQLQPVAPQAPQFAQPQTQAAVVQAPVQGFAPVQQGFAPQGQFQQAPGYAPQQAAPQYAPQPQAQFQAQPQFQGQPQYAPQAPQGFPNGGQSGAAVPPWMVQQTQGAPVAQATGEETGEGGGKRGRKKG